MWVERSIGSFTSAGNRYNEWVRIFFHFDT